MKNPIKAALKRRRAAPKVPTERASVVAAGLLSDVVRDTPQDVASGALSGLRLSGRLDENVNSICALVGDSQPDFIVRRFKIGEQFRCAVLFFDTLARSDLVADNILRPLLYDAHLFGDGEMPPLGQIAQTLEARMIDSTDVVTETHFDKVIDAFNEGVVALLVDGVDQCLLIRQTGFPDRAVSEPQSESVVRGPREGFTENIHTNWSLIRRRVGTPLLRFEFLKIGRMTRTQVAIAYIKGVADEALVDEVRTRVERIDIDGVLESNYIEELIEDAPYSPFPTVLNTERPDAVAAALLEGRVAILCNGTPFAIVVPTSFWSLVMASEDYYQRWHVSLFLRTLRLMLIVSVVLLPSLYVAGTTFHPEMLPAPMLISIAAAREAVPFSTFIEVLVLEITFEALREAGIRLPRPIGTTISIVGALVIGQAAVQAGFVSAPVVIIVAFTGVASFVIPHFNLGLAIRLARFLILCMAGAFGLYGVSIGLMLLFLHLTTLRSFGHPYLSPFAPLRPEQFKDSLFRAPWWRMFQRPELAKSGGTRREKLSLRPQPPEPDAKGGSRA